MKVALISDIHDNFINLDLAIKKIKELDIKTILFLGDFGSKKVAKILMDTLIDIHGVWGNNDGEKSEILKLINNTNFKISSRVWDMITIESKKIFLTHHPELAKPMAKSGDYDAVFYGHDHMRNIEKVNNCLIVNPGEIAASRTGVSSIAVYDTQNNDAEIIELGGSISTRT